MNQKDLLNAITKDSTLPQIQEYIRKIVELRGFANESIQETMLLLLEETGELAKAVRKAETHMSVDVNKLHHYSTIESEVADVFFVLTAICNKLHINLLDALKEKEKINAGRDWRFDR